MPYITRDDIIDTYSRLMQRGASFLLSKFSPHKINRTKSAFDETAIHSSNWWMIPMVKERWNIKISGQADMNYRQFLMSKYLSDKENLRLLSLGSGSCTHELELAEYEQFTEIVCVDLAQNRLDEAKLLANEIGLTNMRFLCTDIRHFNFQKEHFDVVLFNSSLHHFQDVKTLIPNYIIPCMKVDGILVINEFVGPNRLQFPKEQIRAINRSLKLIDPAFRKRFKTNWPKNRFDGSGIWRMILADPSECIDSANILPALHQNLETVIEKPLGGNILMNTLKDIAHHFLDLDAQKKDILTKLFQFEDEYLKTHTSDFIFGIYKKTNH